MAVVGDAYKGAVVVFKSHSLRVEAEPLRKGNRIMLEGRENRGGCPYVHRWYFSNLPVMRIDAAADWEREIGCPA